MRVAIVTWGSRGDFQPYLALGLAFQQAGHEVRLGAPPNQQHSELAAAYGVPFVPLGPEVEQSLTVRTANEAIASGNPISSVRLIMDRLMLPVFDECYEGCLELARWSDVVIAHFFQFGGRMAAEATGRPFVSATLVPTQLPSATRSPGDLPNANRKVNAALWKTAVAHMNSAWLGPVNDMRARAGLEPLDDVAERGFYSPDLNLIAMSPLIFPRPDDWGPQHRMTGYWLLPDPEGWSPKHRVIDFMERGPRPVVIGFGSMTSPDPEELTNTIIEAVERADVRAIIQPGLALLGEKAEEHPNILTKEDIQHSWVLPRSSAIVHHGGAGTIAAALYAGIPQVVVPHVFDQHIWARRMKEMKVARDPIPIGKLNAKKLASAIKKVVRDKGVQERAGAVAAELREERGPETAVRLVEEHVRSGAAAGAIDR